MVTGVLCILLQPAATRYMPLKGTFTAVTRVQIPSGTPNLFINLQFHLILYAGTKKAQIVSLNGNAPIKEAIFSWGNAPFRLGTNWEHLSAGHRCGRLQKTNDATLGSSLLHCDCLSIRVQGDPARRMAKQFLRYFDVRFVRSQ